MPTQRERGIGLQYFTCCIHSSLPIGLVGLRVNWGKVSSSCIQTTFITGYLCDPEMCAFWRKMAFCGFYLCVALHGVWLSLQ